jgi:hypothetical protein
LKSALPGAFDASRLRALAEKIAAGNAALPQAFPELSSADPSGVVVHAAVVHGFGLVMVYGGIGVWILAAISFAIFSPLKAKTGRIASASRPEASAIPCGLPPCGD